MSDYIVLVFWIIVLVLSGAAIVYFGRQVYRDWRRR